MRPGGMHQGTTRRVLGNQSAGRSSAHHLAMQRMHPQKALQLVKCTLLLDILKAKSTKLILRLLRDQRYAIGKQAVEPDL